ncbi:MAG: 23S rRNA (pseudouridine(1915)-N(3))-methyltransferase RlmH [Candidatus Competibacteraceae bacterium]
MRIHLIAVGTRMPAWISQGFAEYAQRLPRECRLQLVEIPGGKRAKTTASERAQSEEGEKMLAAIPARVGVIALDERGALWDTRQLAEQLTLWLNEGRDIALLVGGPDGLAPACRRRAEATWSLSPLTFPHALVRVMVAEQLYRAWTIISHHPYHRA